jgi:hypothetical protein
MGKRLKLFGIGVFLGMSMFVVGGLREPGHSPSPEPLAQLQPWLQKTVCDYPQAVDCTSKGSVVTSPALQHGPPEGAG